MWEPLDEDEKTSHHVLIIPKEFSDDPKNYVVLSSFSFVIPVDNYYETGEVELKAADFHAKNFFSSIVIGSESDVLRAAALRELFSIPGQTYKSAQAFRDKLLMKKLLSIVGINVPHFRLIETGADILFFITEYGYPAIIKPRVGFGSEEVYVVKTDADLRHVMANPAVITERSFGYFTIERFVNDPMYYVDGLVHDGNLVFASASVYTSPCLEVNKREDMSRKGYAASFLLDDEDPIALQCINFSKIVLAALPTPKNTAFFLEFFYNNTIGEFTFCEIASRSSGPPNPYIIKTAFGINIYKQFRRLQLGLDPTLPKSFKLERKLGGVIFGTQQGIFRGFNSQELPPFVIDHVLLVDEGKFYETSRGFTSLGASFIIESDSLDDFNHHVLVISEIFRSSFFES